MKLILAIVVAIISLSFTVDILWDASLVNLVIFAFLGMFSFWIVKTVLEAL